MSRIELAEEEGEDFDRILDHLAEHQVEHPDLRLREIIAAINVLEHNPLIGRPVRNDKRELVIGRRSHGHVARYRYLAEIETVLRFSFWPSAASEKPAMLNETKRLNKRGTCKNSPATPLLTSQVTDPLAALPSGADQIGAPSVSR